MRFLSLAAVFVTVICVHLSRSDDLQVGTSVGGQLAYAEEVKLMGLPLTTRTKNVFFSSETNQVIRGISAIDMSNSSSKPIVTAGGVGSSFANIRLKSERGEGLSYQVQFFV